MQRDGEKEKEIDRVKGAKTRESRNDGSKNAERAHKETNKTGERERRCGARWRLRLCLDGH